MKPLRQEPEAPFINATSRGLQKAPGGSRGLSASGVILSVEVLIWQKFWIRKKFAKYFVMYRNTWL
ncbi:MAG: hypothetical protein STSR0002_01570 [Smithella sp.]